VLEETGGPKGTRPKVSLPVATERRTPKRSIIPPVRSVTTEPVEEPEERKESA